MTRTCHDTSMELLSLCFLPVPNLRRNLHSTFSPLCRTDSHVVVSPDLLILTSWNQNSVVIHPPYSHDLHFLPVSRTFISYTSFSDTKVFDCNSLPWVAREPCTRWKLSYQTKKNKENVIGEILFNVRIGSLCLHK